MKPKSILYLFICLLLISKCLCQVSGYIVDGASKEKLQFVTIKNLSANTSSISNKYGFFSIGAQLEDSLEFTTIGFRPLILKINSSNQLKKPQNVILNTSVFLLDDITILGRKESVLNETEPGKIYLPSNLIKELSMLLGEKDPIKALTFLPGIQEVSEGSSAISVRGGNVNQNLLLLDEAVVYNANHLFGFFSTFNADPINYIEAYKGPFPAQYGGRLSSIIDVRMREGNKDKLKVEGGIGLISSRMLLEGPIKKNLSSFIISARRTYLDLLINPFQSQREKTSYYFGDLNIKINQKINEKNDFFLSFYMGTDDFYQKNKIPRRGNFLINNTLLNWGNKTITARWNKIYSPKLFQNTSFLYTNYKMGYTENTKQDYLSPPRFQEVKLESGIKDYSVKTDFDYFWSNRIILKAGLQGTFHIFNPRDFYYESSRAEESFINNSKVFQNFDIGSYMSLKQNFEKYIIESGLRLSYFNSNSPVRFEPRIMLLRRIGNHKTVSISYSRMNQYLHQISNTGNGLPTDAWIPSSLSLKPSSSDIISFSLFAPLLKGVNLSFETYYKWIKGNTEYKSGVNFLGVGQGAATTPFSRENSLTQGNAWNYGYELSIQKTKGKLTGFGGYTLAWAINKFEDLNNSKPFYSRQDRRHILEFSLQYKLSVKNLFSGNFFFATGNPLSIPSKVFFREDRYTNYLEAYSGINTFRAENSHRLDLSYTHFMKTGKNSIEFGLYNAYFRKNPYNYETKNIYNLTDRTQKVIIERSWLFPIIPSITFNFKI